MQENHLAKWLNGELSEAELVSFKETEGYSTYQKLAEATAKLEAPEFDTDKALNHFRTNTTTVKASPKVIALRPFKGFLKVAAAVAVLITGAYFYMQTLEEATTTQFAELKTVELPDTSEVVLNADSKLSYDGDNWEDVRNVKLEGEAFFKVAKGKTFTVSTTSGTVSVLGTQFNVENREDFFEVTCFEGLVSVMHKGEEHKLPAGNSFIVYNNKTFKDNVAANTTPAWINKESTFKSIPLNFVLNELERQHNITVETENIDLNQLFTGTFSNTNINLALQSISVPSQIKFNLEENNVLFYADKQP